MLLHVALALQLQAGAAPARAPRVLTPETYLSLRTPGEPALSPDGRRVAYTVRTPDLGANDEHDEVWLASLAAGGARTGPVQLTRTATGASAPAWSPDGRTLAYLSEDPAPGEDPDDALTQVWTLSLDGGAPRPLTESLTGVEFFAWLPDGSGVLYVRESGRAGAVAALHRSRRNGADDELVMGREPPRHELWRADDDGQSRIWRGMAGLSDFRISPDGRWVVAVANAGGGPDDDRLDDLWLLNIDAGTARRLTTRPGGEFGPRFSPDGARLAFGAVRDTAVGSSNDELWVMELGPCLTPRAAGPCGAVDVSAPLDRDVYDWRWAGNGRLLVSVAAGTYAPLYALDLGADGRWVPAPVVADSLVVDEFDVTADGRTLVAVLEGPRTWPDLWRIDLAPSAPAPARRGTAPAVTRTNLTRLNPVLDSLTLARQEVVSWRAPDGETVEGVLVRPIGEPAGPQPLLVTLHGGPHANAENILRDYYTAQLFAARGYAVLAPNYRGSTGSGNRWGSLNTADLGGGDWRDVASGVDAMVARGIADSTRLAIKGQSYGGYLTDWAVTQTPRFRAAISESGIASFVTDFSNSEISSFERDYLRAWHWENPTLYRERSPLTYVDRIRTPLLLIHGEEDANTAPANSIELWRALRTLGRTVELVRYPREGHGLDEPVHRLGAFRRQVAWLDRWVLRGGAAPTVYGIGDEVPAADTAVPWTLTLTAVEWDPDYIGQSDTTGHTELTFLLRRVSAAPRRGLRFDWVQDVRLDSAPPVGVPVDALDETVLVEGGTLRTAVTDDADVDAVAVRLVFARRAGEARQVTLQVRGFAPVRLDR